MNKKLYVGNLNYATTEDELRNLFAEAGSVVSCVVITDKMTGRSKGFGFVEMETEQAAQAAIDRFHDFELNQRKLTVNEARPPQSRPPRGGSGGGHRGGGGGGRGRGGGYSSQGGEGGGRRY